MNDKIISFETAKLAKEKGFDGKIDNWYRIIDLTNWLREKHSIYIWAIPVNGGESFNHELEDLQNRATETEQLFSFDHKTYEDAIEFGLIKALQLI